MECYVMIELLQGRGRDQSKCDTCIPVALELLYLRHEKEVILEIVVFVDMIGWQQQRMPLEFGNFELYA